VTAEQFPQIRAQHAHRVHLALRSVLRALLAADDRDGDVGANRRVRQEVQFGKIPESECRCGRRGGWLRAGGERSGEGLVCGHAKAAQLWRPRIKRDEASRSGRPKKPPGGFQGACALPVDIKRRRRIGWGRLRPALSRPSILQIAKSRTRGPARAGGPPHLQTNAYTSFACIQKNGPPRRTGGPLRTMQGAPRRPIKRYLLRLTSLDFSLKIVGDRKYSRNTARGHIGQLAVHVIGHHSVQHHVAVLHQDADRRLGSHEVLIQGAGAH